MDNEVYEMTIITQFEQIFELCNKNDKLQEEIDRLNNIINKAIEYTEIQIEDEYEYHGLMYHNDEKDKLLNILKGDDKEIIEEDKKIEKINGVDKE